MSGHDSRPGSYPGVPVLVRGEGLVLREWKDGDVPVMVELFDTAEMDRWTPLAHPFTLEVAAEYVRRAHQAKYQGTLQMAITTDRDLPLGEVLLFPGDTPDVCEFAYAVGAAHRGRHLAARAIRALFPTARSLGYHTAALTIADDNRPSQHTAIAAGFTRESGPLRRRERKGYILHMAAWTRPLL
jgi:RimJ/RimL family protein N-acetyltransferase